MRESRRIFRFAVIGTLNALIIAAVIWLMMDELDIDYMLSNITAYVIAQTHNFIWCKHWIFPLDDKEKGNYTLITLIFKIFSKIFGFYVNNYYICTYKNEFLCLVVDLNPCQICGRLFQQSNPA